MSPLPPLHNPGIVYDPRLGIKLPQAQKGPPITGKEQYPERYIFLLLAILLFIRFVNLLRQHQRTRDLQSTAEYERLESGPSGLEEDEVANDSELPRVIIQRVLLPSEIAQLSHRPTDDPYYVASFNQNASNPASQLPEYDQLIQFSTNLQCDNESGKATASEHHATYFGDLPPTYCDATAHNTSGSPSNT